MNSKLSMIVTAFRGLLTTLPHVVAEANSVYPNQETGKALIRVTRLRWLKVSNVQTLVVDFVPLDQLPNLQLLSNLHNLPTKIVVPHPVVLPGMLSMWNVLLLVVAVVSSSVMTNGGAYSLLVHPHVCVVVIRAMVNQFKRLKVLHMSLVQTLHL